MVINDRKVRLQTEAKILVGKVMSLLFNTLSRFVTALLPRNKYLLISRLQSSFAVILQLLMKAMAPHSTSLAWKIPWMEEPGRL